MNIQSINPHTHQELNSKNNLSETTTPTALASLFNDQHLFAHCSTFLDPQSLARLSRTSTKTLQAVTQLAHPLIAATKTSHIKPGLILIPQFFAYFSETSFPYIKKRTQQLLDLLPEDLRPQFPCLDTLLLNPDKFHDLLQTHMNLSIITLAEILKGPTRNPDKDLGLQAKQAREYIRALKGISGIRLTSQNLATLPPEIALILSLEFHLDLSNNFLHTLPTQIRSLFWLNKLNLENNQIHTLPQEITALRRLKKCNLKDNLLHTLPPEFDKLSSLKKLILSNPLASSPEIESLKQRMPALQIFS